MNPLVILSWGQRWAVGSRDLCNLSIYIYIYTKITAWCEDEERSIPSSECDGKHTSS